MSGDDQINTQATTCRTQPSQAVALTQLLGRPVIHPDGHPVGRVLDVVAKRSDGPTLWVTGMLVGLDDERVLVPTEQFTVLSDAVQIDCVVGFDAAFQREPADLLLVADVLGRPLIDLRRVRLVRARDIELARRDGRWLVAGVHVASGPGRSRTLSSGSSQNNSMPRGTGS